jgi:hypothetical protein
MVWMTVKILPPIPPWINQSYTPFGFYKFGCCCWQYQDPLGNVWDGEVEWINTQNFVTKAKLGSVYGFRWFLWEGLLATFNPVLEVAVQAPSIEVNGTFVNPVTGEGFPLLIPP